VTVTAVARLRRLTPSLDRLLHYQRGWLRGDVLAGVTVAAYLVPQCMAYGELAGLEPVVGLWAILPALGIYAVLGSSRQLSVGPESTTAVMTAVALAPLAAGDYQTYAALAAALALLVGAACLIGFAFKLGFLADLLSRPILVGYMAGVALIMIGGQLSKVTGVPIDSDKFFSQLADLFTNLDQLDPSTTILAAAVLAFLLVSQRLAPRWPGPLIAVLLSTAVVATFNLDDNGISVVGEIPAGLPSLQAPDVGLGDVSSLLLPALGIALVGYSDNVLTSRAFAARNRYRVDANQELLALGAANAGAGLLQGFPVSSSGSRTVLGDSMGSRSQLNGLVAAASVILVLLFLRPLLANFPSAALGAIVIYAAIRLIDVVEFKRLGRFRRSELVLALATTAGVLAFDILYGVLVAIALSVIDMLHRVARPHDAVQGKVPGLASLHDVDDYPDAATQPGLVIYRYDAPLFFANAQDFRDRALAAVDSETDRVEWFVLNVEANTEIDITAVDALEEVRRELEHRGIRLGLARLKQDLRADLMPSGLLERIGDDMVFASLPTVLERFAARHSDD
jgi:sulfate permease, SulP family